MPGEGKRKHAKRSTLFVCTNAWSERRELSPQYYEGERGCRVQSNHRYGVHVCMKSSSSEGGGYASIGPFAVFLFFPATFFVGTGPSSKVTL